MVCSYSPTYYVTDPMDYVLAVRSIRNLDLNFVE
jgi:hypothetical protein